eukprot:scaffold17353_cov135-Isochrysis_galbana.AAC.1
MTHPRPMAMPGRPHPQPQPSHQASLSGPPWLLAACAGAGRLEPPSGGTPATRPAATACVAPPPWAPPLQPLPPPWPPPPP